MPLKTEKNGQIVKQNPDTAIGKRDDMLKQIALWRGEIHKALPRHVTPERMMAVIRTAFSRNEKLLE